MAYAGHAHLTVQTGTIPPEELLAPNILNEVTGINLKTTGPTTLYTVPADKILYLTDIILVITAADTFATPVTVRVGLDPAFTEWLAATSLTGLDSVGDFISLGKVAAGMIHKVFAAGEVVALDITVGAGATTLTATAYPIGMFFNP